MSWQTKPTRREPYNKREPYQIAKKTTYQQIHAKTRAPYARQWYEWWVQYVSDKDGMLIIFIVWKRKSVNNTTIWNPYLSATTSPSRKAVNPTSFSIAILTQVTCTKWSAIATTTTLFGLLVTHKVLTTRVIPRAGFILKWEALWIAKSAFQCIGFTFCMLW